MNNRPSLSEMFAKIETQVMCDSAPQLAAPFRLAEPVLIADHAKEPVIAIDSRAPHAPELLTLETMSLSSWPVTSDAAEMDEAAYLRSLFEGVPHTTGERLVQEYQRQKQLNAQLAKAARRKS